jgi:AcrR family transcriptional regulator
VVRTPKVRKNDTRADARRRQLLDAAEACFADHGFHAAGMARISDQAGMSIGNIYGYFENKDAIICAIVDAQVSAMQAGLERLLESTGDISEAFKQQAAVQIRNCTLENRSALMFDIMAEMGRNPVIATAMQAHDEKVRRQLLDITRRFRPGWAPEKAAVRVELLMLLIAGVPVRLTMHPDQDGELLLREIQRQIDVLFEK